jgi:hypothetical protein
MREQKLKVFPPPPENPTPPPPDPEGGDENP